MRRRPLLALVAVAGLAGAVLLMPVFAHEGHGKTETSSFDPYAPKRVSPETALAIGLATAEVDFAEVEDVLRLTGIVRPVPDRVHAVAPQYAGIIRKINVQPGDTVRAGDAIVEVESPDLARNIVELRRLEAEYQKLQADAKQALASIRSLEIEVPATEKGADLAEAEAQRLEASGEAVSANLLAQRRGDALRQRADAQLKAVALEQARVNVESMRSQVESAAHSIEAVRALVPTGDVGVERAAATGAPGTIAFHSPIDGVVSQRTGVVGQGVDAGSTILVIADFAQVQIDGEVPESLLSRLTAAQSLQVRIRGSSDAALLSDGTVRFISPVIDASKRTAHVIIDAANPSGKLKQGQFVELAVVLSANDTAVVVPASAIVREGPMEFVFVKEGEFFKKRDVATGVRDDRIVEIRQGLVPGDVVATGGAFSLSQLRGVTVGPAPATPAAPAESDGHGHSHD